MGWCSSHKYCYESLTAAFHERKGIQSMYPVSLLMQFKNLHLTLKYINVEGEKC